MKLNFHITWEDNAILLPLDGSAQAFVQHFDRKDWRTSIAQMEEQEKAKAGATISLLHGQWMELLEYLAQESDPEVPVRIIAWDFQQPMLRMLRERVSVKYEYEKTSHASVKAWLVFQNQIFIYVERQRSGACAGNKAVAQSSPLDASIGALVRTHVR